MIRRSGALALLLAAVACAPALAKPTVPVNVRIEGKRDTLFEGRVLAPIHQVDSGDGTGPHTCDGTNGGANATPGPTLLSAFDDAVHMAGRTWAGQYSTGFQDFTIDRVGPDSSDTKNGRYWGQVLNYKDTQLGGCQLQVKPGDQVLVAFNSFGRAKLRLSGPSHVTVGKPFTVTVTNGETGKPFEGALVRGGTTGPRGHVSVLIRKPGTHRFKARATDAIRSAALVVDAS
jgi:hypothetical protein